MYEIAKELGVPSKDLLAKLSSMGVEAKSHSSTVTQDVADKLRSSVGGGGRQARAGQPRQDQGDARPAQGRSGQAGQARSGQPAGQAGAGQARSGQPSAEQPRVVKAADLSGVPNLLFRRNSRTGAVEVLPRSGSGILLNTALHT